MLLTILAAAMIGQAPFDEAALRARNVELTKVIAENPQLADAYQARGMVRYKLGQVDESIADFDRYIALNPKAKISHWQRGISYYYAGKFKEGQAQFEGYQDFDDNDVENAVWRYMCQRKIAGKEKATKEILKIGDDKRVPMRQVYDLYAGKIGPDDVLKAAGKVSQQLFYAHLYLGIWFDLEGDQKKALEHLELATTMHPIGHYMWDVARIHRDILKKKMP